MQHGEREHELQIALATALRERDEARAHSQERANGIDMLKTKLSIAESALAAARRECERLQGIIAAALWEVNAYRPEAAGNELDRAGIAPRRPAAPGDGEDAGFAETTAKDGETYVTGKPQGSG